MRQIYRYSRDNLALVNVYIKNPVVTQIRWEEQLWNFIESSSLISIQERSKDSRHLVCCQLRGNLGTLHGIQHGHGMNIAPTLKKSVFLLTIWAQVFEVLHYLGSCLLKLVKAKVVRSGQKQRRVTSSSSKYETSARDEDPFLASIKRTNTINNIRIQDTTAGDGKDGGKFGNTLKSV